jgi:hypothetical protein
MGGRAQNTRHSFHETLTMLRNRSESKSLYHILHTLKSQFKVTCFHHSSKETKSLIQGIYPNKHQRLKEPHSHGASALPNPLPYSLFPPNALTILITLPPSVGLFSNARSFAYRFSYCRSVSSSSTPYTCPLSCTSSPCELCEPWRAWLPRCGIAIGVLPNCGRTCWDSDEERRWAGPWGMGIALLGEEE